MKPSTEHALTSGAWGAGGAAAILLALGFVWPGLVVLEGTAKEMAAAESQAAVVSMLAPVCAERARNPEVVRTIAAESSPYGRRKIVDEHEWATFRGTWADSLDKRAKSSFGRDISDACGTEIRRLQMETAEVDVEKS